MSYYTEGNILSVLAFFVWIPIALYGARRWPPAKAMAFVLFGGLLLLPEVVFFKPSGLPEFAKLEIILVWILLGALLFHRQRLKSAPRSWQFKACVGLLVVGSIVTVFLNLEGLSIGSRELPGQVPYDAVHAVITVLLSTVLPFYLGSLMFRSAGDLRVLLTTMMIAALLCSPLQLIEIRFSPQLHNWVYGFHQHSFSQTIRETGYRPMVFMAHGLALALFTSLAVTAAAALHKGKVRALRFPAVWVASYLWVVLLLSKSLASLLYSLTAVPLVLFASPRTQALAATALVGFLTLYPVVRAHDLIPVDEIHAFAAEQYGPERAHSLMFRFTHEEKTLERALERPWFGWGAYCRACLFDPWSGDPVSIRDGAWIIQLGDYGIVGFIGKFGLLLFPLIALIRRIRYVPRESDRRLLAGLGLMTGVAAIDLLPNGDFTRLPFILSGALLGCLTGILQQAVAVRNKKRLERIAAAREGRAVATSVAGIAVLWVSLVAAPASATPDAVGGGFADAGIEGTYYANPDLEGTPAFTRRDVRIDFDWAKTRAIGGSTAQPYRSFPRDRFSIRWSGRIIPRFSEAYHFVGEADDGVRIRVRAPGQSRWSTVVDRWDEAGAFESKPFKMRANELHDIQVEYREVAGEARCRLMWKSQSTPIEVIDPVRQQGINLSGGVWAPYLWADMVKSARYGQGAEKIDPRGWPTESEVELIASEGATEAPEMSGAHLLRFEGKAEVRQECCVNAVFEAGGNAFEQKLPKGVGYDASTNTTTSVVQLDGSRTMLVFDHTERSQGRRGDGVSRIRLMRPITPGSAKIHRPDEIVYRPFKRVIEDHFTTLRFLPSQHNPGGKWSQRTLPDYAFFMGTNEQENWEYLIMLANETGRDLYVSIPIRANDEYLEKLALLMRYGSDGHEPYRGPTADPIYPPLNPNLRIYVEWDNEIWNWAFATTQVAQSLTQAEHDKGSSTWKVVNYDGQAGNPEHLPAIRRWHAVRTVQASKAFRRVWGADAMGSRVRVLVEYQYDNYQDSALSSLDFIDAYYNNRSNKNVSDPHPVSYYLWGAGGAAYYGLRNGTGRQTHTLFANPSFEETTVEPKTLQTRPPGAAWTFTGRAGLIRPHGAKSIDGLQNLTPPTSGKQAAFLVGNGSISQKIGFAKPGTYSIAFQAAGSDEGWPGYQPFDVLLDGRKVSPRSQKDYRVSLDTALIGGWARSINTLDEEWGSAVFRIERPGVHKISFVGRDEAPNYLLIDDVRIASADAITTSGFHKGEALGEAGIPDLIHRLQSQAKYARAFGLQVVAYEAGWSVGGDFHQMPIQNWCKLEDPRVMGVNDDAIEIWDRSGSFLPVWGVYQYWPEHDFAGAGNYSIMRSFRAATQRLPDEPTFGRRLPTTLRVDDADWSHVKETRLRSLWCRFASCEAASDQWHAWMLIAPATGAYAFRVEGRGSGRVVVEVDGTAIAELNSLEVSGSSRLTAKLTQGAHAVRIVLVDSGLELDRIEISVPPAGR